MIKGERDSTYSTDFHLSKWFLDFVDEEGCAMIFYSAKLRWHGWTVSYVSWLRFDPVTGVRLKTRFSNVREPQVEGNLVKWNDPKFGVSGTWESLAEIIQTRIIDSEHGYIDWKCYQPASMVELKIGDNLFKGRGYAEQLILTILPWKIPMNELRWGRFGSEGINIVWIELMKENNLQWIWLNGEKIEKCTLGDDHLTFPEKDLVLNLDQGVVLESEKKISSVVGKLIRYIPGINSFIPIHFLMADETKWLSKGVLLYAESKIKANGIAIHEMVNFKCSL